MCLVLGECCNRDRDESGQALVVATITITIRSHRLVVRPKVCAIQCVAGHPCVAGHRSSISTSTPMLRAACSADRQSDACPGSCTTISAAFGLFHACCHPWRMGNQIQIPFSNPKLVPHFRWGSTRKRYPKNGRVKNHQFRLHKICTKTGMVTQKRQFSDPETVLQDMASAWFGSYYYERPVIARTLKSSPWSPKQVTRYKSGKRGSSCGPSLWLYRIFLLLEIERMCVIYQNPIHASTNTFFLRKVYIFSLKKNKENGIYAAST